MTEETVRGEGQIDCIRISGLSSGTLGFRAMMEFAGGEPTDVGSLNLGGSIERIPNPVAVAELAVDKQAATLLMPVAARRALNDLPDELWTKVNIEFYLDPADAVFKSLVE